MQSYCCNAPELEWADAMKLMMLTNRTMWMDFLQYERLIGRPLNTGFSYDYLISEEYVGNFKLQKLAPMSIILILFFIQSDCSKLLALKISVT